MKDDAGNLRARTLRWLSRSKGSYAFGTVADSGRKSSRIGSAQYANLVRAKALFDVVQSSDHVKTLRPHARVSKPQLVELVLRERGGIGSIWVPGGSQPVFRGDIDGMPLTASYEGAALEAFCCGTSGDNTGALVRFVFAPRPPGSVAHLHLSVPAYPVDAGRGPIELEISLA